MKLQIFYHFSRINCGICFCSDLSGLWIGYNHIKKIPKKLCELPTLNILDIEHNKVLDLPRQVKRRKLLRIICHGNFIPHSQYKYEPKVDPTPMARNKINELGSIEEVAAFVAV